MNRAEIIGKLEDTFRDFFSDASISLSETTANDDIEAWDSVSHIQLIFEIEEAFGVCFKAEDIPLLSSVKEIADRIEAAA
jgi:acyl carrier protein